MGSTLLSELPLSALRMKSQLIPLSPNLSHKQDGVKTASEAVQEHVIRERERIVGRRPRGSAEKAGTRWCPRRQKRPQWGPRSAAHPWSCFSWGW